MRLQNSLVISTAKQLKRNRPWTVLGMLVGFLFISGCAQPEEQAQIAFHPSTNVQNLMLWVVDPAADVLWGSAGFILTVEGEEDLQPTTEEGWHAVRNNATTVAESGNLLMMPGYAVDDGDWMEYSRGLVDAGIRAREAADAKDAEALFEAGAKLYNVCAACHNRYIIEVAESE